MVVVVSLAGGSTVVAVVFVDDVAVGITVVVAASVDVGVLTCCAVKVVVELEMPEVESGVAGVVVVVVVVVVGVLGAAAADDGVVAGGSNPGRAGTL